VVYVGSDDDNVYAVTTSAQLRTFPTGGHRQSFPAVAAGVVYIGSEDGNVHVLNAATGAPLWSFRTGSLIRSSPAVANGWSTPAASGALLRPVSRATSWKLSVVTAARGTQDDRMRTRACGQAFRTLADVPGGLPAVGCRCPRTHVVDNGEGGEPSPPSRSPASLLKATTAAYDEGEVATCHQKM
jgi:outer membrane protein assembly factor BamB